MAFQIESLLSARLFVAPQVAGKRIYFLSNISGHLSLYAMDYGGSIPEPLLPPNIALQNPHLIGGDSFAVFPKLQKVLVMIDRDGDENYQPMLIPIQGGFPTSAFPELSGKYRVHLVHYELSSSLVYFNAESRENDQQTAFRGNLATGKLERLASSAYGAFPLCFTADHRQLIVGDSYTLGDDVLYLLGAADGKLELLYGTPMEKRAPGVSVPFNGITSGNFTPDEKGLLLSCAVFSDHYGAAYLDLESPGRLKEVKITGTVHQGEGELTAIHKTGDNQFMVEYNIDGCSWLYEASFQPSNLELCIEKVLVGKDAPLSNGMLASYNHDKEGDRYVVSYSTATSPTQIYTIEGKDRRKVVLHTREKVLGIAPELLSSGEDASYVSFDGIRVSARLYMPAKELGFQGPRPLVYYVHGGPQGQERPDFAWFSMPIIQHLTLNGFAVFVPNVRGSTGYGLAYAKHVDRDWGGQDRLDHVHALKILAKDPRVDVKRAGVVGRSYGGYMTLTLASRHPELWSAAVDMFGPFDLTTFLHRIPETWKPYFYLALGDPDKDRAFLLDRSPKTHIDQVTCPMLVIQGKNDPRVVERESRDLVEYMRSKGKTVDYLMFENEGHDVLRYENRVTCYNAITEFFKQHLKP